MKLTYRLASEADLVEIVSMLSDDKLGAEREAFQSIPEYQNQQSTVVERKDEIVA